MIRDAIGALSRGENLPLPVIEGITREIMTGNATDAQIAAFLTAMTVKGETVDEISACARITREYSVRIAPRITGMLVDTCGTGGDGAGTFNISTAAAFVAAGAGVPVVKHGNRSASGRCGSADVLEALGVGLNIPFDRLTEIIEVEGIGFLFAPRHHPAMKYAAGARRDIGIRSIFNLIGPLANPAGASAQLLGVHSPDLTVKMAEVLGAIGVSRALVVHGSGLDEITTTGPTRVTELRDKGIRTYEIDPDEFGFPLVPVESLRGGGAPENARIIRKVLAGEAGPARDIVVMNAGAAVYIGGGSGTVAEGIKKAEAAIDSGNALSALERTIAATGAYP